MACWGWAEGPSWGSWERADGLAGWYRGGGSGRLGGNLLEIEELAEEGVLGGTSRGSGELDGTSRGSGELDGTSRGSGDHGEVGGSNGKGSSQKSSSLKLSKSSESSSSSPSVVGVWAGLTSIPSISTMIPTVHDVAGSHTWSVALSSGSGAMSGSVTLNGVGSVIAAGSGSAAGSGEHSVQRDGEGWLGSGSGVRLELSSAGQMEKNSPLFSSTHSTQAAKFSFGPSAGRRALHRSLRLVM